MFDRAGKWYYRKQLDQVQKCTSNNCHAQVQDDGDK